MSASTSSSPMIMPLSSSPHVALLDLHQRMHSQHLHQDANTKKDATAADANTLSIPPISFHLLSPSPSPTSPSAAVGDSINDVASSTVPLPLPSGWSSTRTIQLSRPSEQRMLSQLRIDTSDTHLLRRGLYVACAVMYLPEVLGIKEYLSTNTHPSNTIVAPSPVSASSISSITSVLSSINLPSDDGESIASIHVPSTFQVTVVEGGITNQLYKCSLATHPDQPVLVRIYGPRTELVIDRSKENEVVDMLSLCGAGPKIFGRFENGRLESWLSGTSCTPAQMRDPHLSGLIAGALTKLHIQPMPFPREAVIDSVLTKWSAIASEVTFPESPTKQKQLDDLDLPSIIAETKSYLASTTTSVYGAATAARVVFAHNDLLSGNVMYDSVRDAVALVDFEYGNYNPRGFDLANHFCECCGFDCDWSVFPTPAAQLLFIRHYLAAIRQVPMETITPAESHELYAEVQCWLLAPHLFWGLWAVVQAKYSPIAFDYLSYAHQRMAGFRSMKAKCQEWLKKTKEDIEQMTQLE